MAAEIDLGSEPDELRAALQSDLEASAAFRALPVADRHEYFRWVNEANEDETRRQRAAQVLDRVKVNSDGRPADA